MTFAGLLILASGFLLMTLGSIPWLAPKMAAARHNSLQVSGTTVGVSGKRADTEVDADVPYPTIGNT